MLRAFFLRSLITAAVFVVTTAMMWLMLRVVREITLQSAADRLLEVSGSAPSPAPPSSGPAPGSLSPPASLPASNSPPASAANPAGALTSAPVSRNVLAEMNDIMANVVERALPGVVSVKVERQRTVTRAKTLVPRNIPQMEARTITEQGVGSGTIVSAAGYVITNWHVVDDEGGTTTVTIRVMLHGEETLRNATLEDSDKDLDIALLKIEPAEPGEKFSYLTFGDSDLMRQAHMVLAVGSPLDLAETVTQGIISNRSRRVSDIQTSFFQTDCTINPGNSGGPLLNINGEVVGINTRMVEPPEQPTRQILGQAYGLAIPSNEVQDAYDRMLHKGKPRGYLGISVEDYPSMSYQLGQKPESVVVLGVERGSPAATAGLKKDDVVQSLDDQPVRGATEFFRRLRRKEVGENLEIGIRRDGQDLKLTAQVANLDALIAAQPAPESQVVAGMTVRNLRQAEQIRYHLLKPTGVYVESVAADSPVSGGKAEGQVIFGISDGRSITYVSNVADFIARMKELETAGGEHYLCVLGTSGSRDVDRVLIRKS